MNNTQPNPQTATKSINLIDGIFTASEAADILNVMIDKKINFHKVQIMCINEGNNEDPCAHDNSRLRELQLEKQRLGEIIQNARNSGKRLELNALIKIEMTD